VPGLVPFGGETREGRSASVNSGRFFSQDVLRGV
jgi:hypothetical protein